MNTRAEVPVLPLENVVLVKAFGRRSRKITRQALLEFAIGEDDFEGVFMMSPQLANEDIIGCQMLKEYGININVERGSISYVRDGLSDNNVLNRKRSRKVNYQIMIQKTIDAIRHPLHFSINHK
jgi:hypothetical protein